MNKQTKHPSLFEQALAIAMREGNLQFSKDADPLQSGVDGENYLLFSRERKLLISIPLEKLKRNTSKGSNTGCLVLSIIGIPFLLFCCAISVPVYISDDEDSRSTAASSTLATIAKECFVKIADKGSGTVVIPELKGYKSKKKNVAGFYLGNNRKLSGTSIVCPTTGEMKVVSEDESKYPTFSYNFDTGAKTCIAESGSDAEKRGCFNGRW